LHAFKEEGEPRLPVPIAPNAIQEFIVGGAVLLEVEAQVEKRFTQHTGMTQEKGDQ
jgi:hypothetical protein